MSLRATIVPLGYHGNLVGLRKYIARFEQRDAGVYIEFEAMVLSCELSCGVAGEEAAVLTPRSGAAFSYRLGSL